MVHWHQEGGERAGWVVALEKENSGEQGAVSKGPGVGACWCGTYQGPLSIEIILQAH